MGWTSFHLNEPVKQWFVDSVEWRGERKVLDVAIANFSELYAAVRLEDGSVICYTYMIAFYPKSYHNFAYKDMSEFDGVFGFNNCPLRILNLLTPLDDTEENKYAINFRAYNLMARSNDAVFQKIKTGQRFKTIKKVNFPGLGEFDEFQKTGRRGIFLAFSDKYSGIKVKISNIKIYGIK